MNRSEKEELFNNDLSQALAEVRAVLDHWGLNEWDGYLLVRQSARPTDFVIKASSHSDVSKFQKLLARFHGLQAIIEQCESRGIIEPHKFVNSRTGACKNCGQFFGSSLGHIG